MKKENQVKKSWSLDEYPWSVEVEAALIEEVEIAVEVPFLPWNSSDTNAR